MAKKREKVHHTMEFLKGIYNFENYDGFLFVGDPHLASYTPGKRLDVNFTDTVLDKLEQAVNLCITYNLYMIILGDLFDDDEDKDTLMLTKLIRVLKKLPQPPLTIIGNHEKTQHKLTEDTFVAVLREAGVLYTIEKNSYWGRFKINNEHFYVGGTPYGFEIPNDVTGLIDKTLTEIVSYTIWITHHDLAIGTYYPGCLPPKEIKGCDIVVNGHDHSTKDPVIVGQTMYFNPGNISRMTIDKKDHVPQVWAWWPKDKRKLEPFPLKYKADSFNLTGKQVIVPEKKLSAKEEEKQESKFLQLLEQTANDSNNENLTTDAEIVEKNITTLSTILSIDPEITQELIDIAKDCSKELR